MDSLKTDRIRIDKQADVFINKTATKTLTSTSVVEKVMKFHFKDLIKAFAVHSSIEISGFGRFEISQNKLQRRLRELESYIKHFSKTDTEKYKRDPEQTKLRLESMLKERDLLLARKLSDETKFEGYCRRMAQSLDATSKTEGVNSAD